MMKKLTVLLALCLCLCLTACHIPGMGAETPTTTTASPTVTTTTTTEAESITTSTTSEDTTTENTTIEDGTTTATTTIAAVTTTAHPTTTTTAKPTTTTTTKKATTTTTTKKATTTTTTTKATTTTTKATTTTTAAPPTADKPDGVHTAMELEVFRLLNEERQSKGLRPLTLNAEGHAAAEVRAQEASVNWSHTRPNGTSCFTVLDEFNISYWTAGENLALGYPNAAALHNGWKNSPGHYANMMGANFTSVALAIYVTPNGIPYACELFLG